MADCFTQFLPIQYLKLVGLAGIYNTMTRLQIKVMIS